MNRLIIRIWLLLTIAFMLNACSSTAPTVKQDKTMTYRTNAQARTAPPRNFFRSSTYPSVKHDKTMAYRTNTQARTAPPQNFYRSVTHTGAFQIPGDLEPAVEFWCKTYTVWHRSEVAFHDDRYLDVIYEVMVLPGYVG
ncbi:MAG: hypothetical protein WAW61_10030, partial [Methylococcaceae bacterium]